MFKTFECYGRLRDLFSLRDVYLQSWLTAVILKTLEMGKEGGGWIPIKWMDFVLDSQNQTGAEAERALEFLYM